MIKKSDENGQKAGSNWSFVGDNGFLDKLLCKMEGTLHAVLFFLAAICIKAVGRYCGTSVNPRFHCKLIWTVLPLCLSV